jgi:hypothetical protein
MASSGGNGSSSEPVTTAGAIGDWLTDRARQAPWTTVLGGGALLGAAVGAATAMRSRPDDVITGQVSVDLLKKVELLTVRLRIDRS